jgi:multimeric flavodoxin WrbA
MRRVLVFSASPRKGGNSDTLCDGFIKGAQNAGNAVEKIRVPERKIGYCLGCYYCKDHEGRCVLNDDMGEILQKIIDADVLVFATPVYFYSMNAQLKTLIDRTVARWTEIANKDL